MIARMNKPLWCVVVVMGFTWGARGLDVFVAPGGDDSNAGTLEKPFATVQRAQGAVGPGDTVYVRGGKYLMTEAQITTKERIWAYVTLLDKSGTPEKRINYFAYQ